MPDPDDYGLPTGDVHVLPDLPGWDPTLGDPGRDWHPHADSPEWASDGTLRDLSSPEVYDHTNKPEGRVQLDGLGRLFASNPGALVPLRSAEDSAHSPDGQV